MGISKLRGPSYSKTSSKIITDTLLFMKHWQQQRPSSIVNGCSAHRTLWGRTKGSHSYCASRSNESFPMTGIVLRTGMGARMSEEKFSASAVPKAQRARSCNNPGRFTFVHVHYKSQCTPTCHRMFQLNLCVIKRIQKPRCCQSLGCLLKTNKPIRIVREFSFCSAKIFFGVLSSLIPYRHLKGRWKSFLQLFC